MKPIQVAILVVAAAIAGGLITKWQTSRNLAPEAAAAVPATPAPAPAPPVEPATAEPAQAPEPAHPSPFPEEKSSKASARKTRRPHRAEPEVVAQNLPPEPTPPAEPAPAVRPEPVTPEPTPAVQPVQEPPAPALAPVPSVPPPPAPRQVTLMAGTLIPARTIEGLSSDRNQAGDGFTATLDAPLVVNGLVIAERGAHLEGKVVEADRAGRLKGLSDLSIELTQLTTSDGQHVPIETESFIKHGQSSARQNAAKIGGGAALGAIIGAVAGGGAGAAIGTAVGAAAGTGGAMATRGKAVAIAPETRISFRLKNTVTLTERRGNQ